MPFIEYMCFPAERFKLVQVAITASRFSNPVIPHQLLAEMTVVPNHPVPFRTAASRIAQYSDGHGKWYTKCCPATLVCTWHSTPH